MPIGQLLILSLFGLILVISSGLAVAETEVYKESFFCGCNPNASKTKTVECPLYPSEHLTGGRFEWIKLLPLATGGAGVCTGDGAPADCDMIMLEEELRNDLYNWLPVTLNIQSLLKGKVFLSIPTELTPSSCDLELAGSQPAVEPPDNLKGDIARRMLYLIFRYNIDMPDRYLQMLIDWDKADPVTKQEISEAQRIDAIQGTDNAFIVCQRQSKSDPLLP